ncbi:MAG: PTS sugar transporter subunit IIC [Saccharofermentans sp.]|nr:PTS sugar transporter subunit IIC [Saccharofermentans sp.]
MGKSKAKKKSNKANVSAAKPAEKTVVSASKPEVKAKKKRTWNEFLNDKQIKVSAKTYFVDAMGGMAQGLFASLLIGTILSTLAKYLGMIDVPFFVTIAHWIGKAGSLASAVTGAAIGVGIAFALKAPMLVMACAAAVGYFANAYPGFVGQCGLFYLDKAYTAGPLGVFIAVIFAVEFGKMVSKETKVDILVTPIVTLGVGFFVAYLTCPPIAIAMNWLGEFINTATTLHPFAMGIIISVVVGIILTLPISSAAICASIGIAGIAGGAALAGCCAQMVGFAVASYRENKWGGVVSQGLGTSMLQMPNIMTHPQIWIPATLASAITGPMATMIFKLECNGVSAGMGTCGLVGPIGCFSAMTESGTLTPYAWLGMFCICLFTPAVLSLIFSEIMRKLGWIKEGYMKLQG